MIYPPRPVTGDCGPVKYNALRRLRYGWLNNFLGHGRAFIVLEAQILGVSAPINGIGMPILLRGNPHAFHEGIDPKITAGCTEDVGNVPAEPADATADVENPVTRLDFQFFDEKTSEFELEGADLIIGSCQFRAVVRERQTAIVVFP